MYNLKAFILFFFFLPFFLWDFRHLPWSLVNYNGLLSRVLRHPAGDCWGEHAFKMINPLAFQRSVLLGPQPLPRKDTLWPPAPGSKETASKLKVSLDLMPKGNHKINYVVWLGRVDFYVQPKFRNKLWSGQLALCISSFPYKVRKLIKNGYGVSRARHWSFPMLVAPAPLPWLDTQLYNASWLWISV